ncbi:HSP20-like chaperone [Dacryopinax primogenitus]|uniref:HSP20-like chaperone n=1 Tax=Dacryopinax primogenitus (strain DJM 731) TaxID=1858805 RepID=M5FQ60_DACPD|nr:HSP20-like chaperone [Dacryopinax primogenitus]EJT98985.1 HSP20-like chaperone [Dacryopinax primogenitus]
MSTHPQVTWAQRSSATVPEKNILYVTVDLPDIVPDTLQLDFKEDSISFKATAGNAARGLPEKGYAFTLDLYASIVPEETKKVLSSRHLALQLRKKEVQAEYWPRLTKIKTPWLKTDFTKWVDEEEQDGVTEPDDLGGMGDMGMGDMSGMPGMGGMGGMPGMGGMGGMPGGSDFNFEEMMAKINAGSPGAAPGGADEDDEDDDDDDVPPPLEAAEPSSSKDQEGEAGSH